MVQPAFVTALPWSLAVPGASDLLALLSRTIRKRERVEQYADQAGLDLSLLDVEQAPRFLWNDVLRQARARDVLPTLLDLVRVGEGAAVAKRMDELWSAAPILEPSRDLDAVPALPSRGELEAILGERSTLVDVAFLAKGARLSRAVGRVLATFDGGASLSGTGFLVEGASGRRVLTNHHVVHAGLGQGPPAIKLEFWLDFERDEAGGLRPHTAIAGLPATLRAQGGGMRGLDWAVFDLERDPGGEYPRLALSPRRPVAKDDRVAIVQHPGGSPKMIGLHQNLVVQVGDPYVNYLTDTEPGSSGAPVFNEDWELVALHHAARDVDVGGKRVFTNEGVRIDRVREALGG